MKTNTASNCAKIIENKAVLLSMRLVAPGLYVAVKEVAATIPGRVSYVKDFRQAIHLLFKFKVHITKKKKIV